MIKTEQNTPRKVLVTGGAGYIGSHTVTELFNAGYEPVIVDNFSNSDRSVLNGLKSIFGKEIKFYEIDCADVNALEKIVQLEKSIIGCIHFAAYKAVGESVRKPFKYYENNIGTLTALLRVMRKFEISELVFSSSCTVYGKPKKLPVTENSPFGKPESPYGRTKQVCEEIISDAARSGMNIKALSLRYFNPIGAHPSGHIGELPSGAPENLVPYITQAVAGLREKLTVFGNDYDTPDGTCIRDYIHICDLADAHVKALDYLCKQEDQKRSFNEAINIGTGAGSSVLEVIRAFEEATGEKVPYTVGARRPGDVPEIVAAADKSVEMLGWEAKLTLKEALKSAYEWQKGLSTVLKTA